jgi:hypothetical protein
VCECLVGGCCCSCKIWNGGKPNWGSKSSGLIRVAKWENIKVVIQVGNNTNSHLSRNSQVGRPDRVGCHIPYLAEYKPSWSNYPRGSDSRIGELN